MEPSVRGSLTPKMNQPLGMSVCLLSTERMQMITTEYVPNLFDYVNPN